MHTATGIRIEIGKLPANLAGFIAAMINAYLLTDDHYALEIQDGPQFLVRRDCEPFERRSIVNGTWITGKLEQHYGRDFPGTIPHRHYWFTWQLAAVRRPDQDSPLLILPYPRDTNASLRPCQTAHEEIAAIRRFLDRYF